MTADVKGINEKLVNELIKRKLKISTAESCTGGLLAALITAVPGSSEIFEESIVTYSNDAKMRELGVKKETLDSVGAVSRDTGADIGIGITGIAGPGGGTDEKTVGTVFIGICVRGNADVLEMHYGGSRDDVREKTCETALEYIYQKIVN